MVALKFSMYIQQFLEVSHLGCFLEGDATFQDVYEQIGRGEVVAEERIRLEQTGQQTSRRGAMSETYGTWKLYRYISMFQSSGWTHRSYAASAWKRIIFFPRWGEVWMLWVTPFVQYGIVWSPLVPPSKPRDQGIFLVQDGPLAASRLQSSHGCVRNNNMCIT